MNKNPVVENIEEDPMILFSRWYNEAHKLDTLDTSLVCLATATKKGAPSNRMMLLQGFDDRGFVIYTNSESRKGREIKSNPKAALCFYWPSIDKQVRVEGEVKPVSEKEADKYFSKHSKEKKEKAWLSKQSQIANEETKLSEKISNFFAKLTGKQKHRPTFWSGYRIIPKTIEFWHRGDYRFHGKSAPKRRKKEEDIFSINGRLKYFKEKNKWKTNFLHP